MRGLEDALARIARRDDLRERSNGTRTTTDRVEEAGATPSVTPVVDEVAEALRGVVRRNPGVFATVVVQEAESAWSVWIGEWDGKLHTRVTQLEPDPPAKPDLNPDNEPTRPLTRPSTLTAAAPAAAVPAPAAAATPAPAAPASAGAPASGEPTVPVFPLPRRRPSRRPAPPRAALPAGRSDATVAQLLQPRRPADDDQTTWHGGHAADGDTPPLGVRPPSVAAMNTLGARRTPAPARGAIPLPGRSAPVDPGAPLPKRIPDRGIPLPRRRPSIPADLGPVDATPPALPALPARPAAHAGSAAPLAAAQRVSGPAMNDRIAGRIADMLRREAKRDNRGIT